MSRIDLNCDVGEGSGSDAELMRCITSANIACGGHAGDPELMRETVALAQAGSVAIGAHPGYADRQNFGRREIPLSPADLRALVIQQVELLRTLGSVRHVKPHGALYNLAARDREAANVVVAAIHEVDAKLVLFGLAGSELVRAGFERGLTVAQEVFGDRTYQRDGSLTPRTKPGALIDDENVMITQVLQMVQTGTVRTLDGSDVAITADTLCLHGDGPHALQFARRLRTELSAAQIAVKAFSTP